MRGPGRRWLRADPADVAAWAVPAVVVVFLALSNGGYDQIARSTVGVAVWWTVLVGTALNFLLPAGGSRAGRVMLVVAIALAAWTALSMTWTESDERTATELARVSTYLAVFTLALAVQGTGRWRQVLHGVTTGVVVVCGLAVLSRMQPSWFPQEIAGRYLQGIQIESRLAYPLNYPSGLGAFAAIGLPLALAGASTARSVVGQSIAAAAIPVVALTLWLTTSSLSVPAAVVALAVFLVLAPDRLPKLATLVLAGGGAAILIVAAEQRLEFDRGLPTPEAERQGHELLALTLLVCAAVGLVQAGLSNWLRHARRPRWLRVPRRHAAVASAVAVGALLVAGMAAGAPSRVDDEWNDFKGRTSANPVEASRGDRDPRLQRQPALRLLGGGGRRQRHRPLGGHRPGHLRLLVDATWLLRGLRPRCPLALCRDARRAGDRRPVADRRPLRGHPRDRRVAGAQGAARPAGGDRRRNRRLRGLRRRRARRLDLGARRHTRGLLHPRGRRLRRGSPRRSRTLTLGSRPGDATGAGSRSARSRSSGWPRSRSRCGARSSSSRATKRPRRGGGGTPSTTPARPPRRSPMPPRRGFRRRCCSDAVGGSPQRSGPPAQPRSVNRSTGSSGWSDPGSHPGPEIETRRARPVAAPKS